MPVLPALATAADLTDYGYGDVPEGVLNRASTRVRRYTRQQITSGTSVVRLPGRPYHLPQRPVTSVTSVTSVDGDELDYEVTGTGYVTVACRGPVIVTYDHGYDVLPDGLVEIVCAVAARLSATPTGVSGGAQTEQAGGESVTWGSDAFGGTTSLTREEKRVLDQWFPRIPKTVHLL